MTRMLGGIIYSISCRGKIAIAWQGIEKILPPNIRDDLCLCFCINPSSMHDGEWMYVLYRLAVNLLSFYKYETQ